MDDTKSNLHEKEKGELLIIYGDPKVEETCIFEKGMYFLCFIFVLCSGDINGYVGGEGVGREIYGPERGGGIRTKDIREEHWMDVYEDIEDKKKIYSLRWNVYTRKKEELTKRGFLVRFTHMKGRNMFWTCVKDNIVR